MSEGLNVRRWRNHEARLVTRRKIDKANRTLIGLYQEIATQYIVDGLEGSAQQVLLIISRLKSDKF